MQINNLEKNNELNINNNLNNERKQDSFLRDNLGKTINTAVDIGIRALLPDLVENQIINIKNNLVRYGLKEGISRIVNDAINIGKSTIGIVTGNFENISQMQEAVKSGGIIDGMSDLIDVVVNKIEKNGIINKNISSTIKQGKNIILSNIDNNIQNEFSNQMKEIEYTNKYINNWKEYYNNKNFDGMEKEYNKIMKQMKIIAPIEKTINEANYIGTLHNFIKNNGKSFDISQEQLDLIKKLQ